ncbi:MULTISPECIES: hypothetical protein [unclassified Ensifer]|uniref:hypothetical protein n=1 Tax=unclassified Ensifer TaxID=2633371 RepID=UPI00300FFCD2
MGNEVNFLSNAADAANQAVKDLAAFQANNGGGAKEVAGALIAGIAGAAAGWSNVGIGLSNLLTGGGASGDALQIEVTNYSSQPVVLYNYTPHSGNVSKIVGPLTQGESDIFVLDRLEDKFSTETSILLQFKVGNVDATVTYSYTDVGDPGRWKLTVEIDGKQHTFDTELQLMGAVFKSGGGEYASFSLYTAPIETGSGQIDLLFYDYAS